MAKHWEFTGEEKVEFGITLRRIRCVIAYEQFEVEIGDLGGWIEKESNLSGNAWVYGNAQVYGDARVSGDAQVSGDARVYGNARVYGDARVFGDARVSGDALVYGDAWVSGDARVYGNAWVYGDAQVSGDAQVFGDAWDTSPLYIQGSRWSLCMVTKSKLKVGCQIHTLKAWSRIYRDVAKYHNAEDILEEYLLYFDVFCKRYLSEAPEEVSGDDGESV